MKPIKTINTYNATIVIGQKTTTKHLRGWDPSYQSDDFDNSTWFKEVATMKIVADIFPEAVVNVIDFSPGRIVLETAETDLHTWITLVGPPKKWQESDHAAIALSMIKATCLVHAAGIIHCDIKPSNMLIFRNPTRVKLADFGFAIPAVSGGSLYPIHTQSYRAPEVVLDHVVGISAETQKIAVNYSSDTWPLGISLLELITGTRPTHTRVEEVTTIPGDKRHWAHLYNFLNFISDDIESLSKCDGYWELLDFLVVSEQKFTEIILARCPADIPAGLIGFISAALRLQRSVPADLAEVFLLENHPAPKPAEPKMQTIKLGKKKLKLPRQAAQTFLITDSPALTAALFVDLEIAYGDRQIPIKNPQKEMSSFCPKTAGF